LLYVKHFATLRLTIKHAHEVADMQNFIVLGIIPGTNIQTNFGFWIGMAAVFGLLLTRYRWVTIGARARNYLLLRKIARTIDRFDLVAL
jgi:hypothetical protein